LERARAAIEEYDKIRQQAATRKFCVEEAVEQTCYQIAALPKCSNSFGKVLEAEATQAALKKEVLEALKEFL
jgi:hypothetical protein